MKKFFADIFKPINKFNNGFAKIATITFGTMWMFYAFVIYGLAPLVWPQYMEQIMYWSSFVQLIALPLLAVGTAILSSNSEKRAQEDHETIMAEFEDIKKILAKVTEVDNEIDQFAEYLKKKNDEKDRG